ncbi:hypothetical protein EDD29_1428 [Actinocorallia herbida]|uniref:Uncharacterized protein n=1 Tax=Actinocorallia herbida TaxID=58109 RepID=A0A3N1CTA3_9ACTN|nr:hypothetical protein EDD29_1428 [Actinocorallia herbida]
MLPGMPGVSTVPRASQVECHAERGHFASSTGNFGKYRILWGSGTLMRFTCPRVAGT